MTPCGLLSHFSDLAPVLLRVRVIFAKETQELWIKSKASWPGRSQASDTAPNLERLRLYTHTPPPLDSKVKCFPCEVLRHFRVSQRYPCCVQLFTHSLWLAWGLGGSDGVEMQTGMGGHVGKFILCACTLNRVWLFGTPPGSSVHGIYQVRILEWVAISFSRGSSRPRDGTSVSCVACTGRWILYQESLC